MLLAIDVGNTHTKFAALHPSLPEGEGCEVQGVHRWRATTDRERTADEWAVHLERFLALSRLTFADLDGCIITSVVPMITRALQEMVRHYLQSDPLVVSSKLRLGILIDHPASTQIGVDRLVNAVAAVEAYGAPLIVIDFGTATTFDVVNQAGAYIGGMITPGVESCLAALSGRATQLFNVPLEFPSKVIGQYTKEAIQSGLLWGYVGLIEGIVTRIQNELGQSCPVIATGGLAELFAPQTSVFTAVDQDITVKGLCLIWARNQS